MGLTDDARDELARAVGVENVRTGEGDLTGLRRDATPLDDSALDAVVFPATTDEIVLLELASRHRIPVVPRGAGSISARRFVAA